MKVKFVPCRSYAVGSLLQTSRQTPADNAGLKRMGGRLLRPVCRSCGGATVGDLCRKCSGPVPRVTSLNRRSLMLGGKWKKACNVVLELLRVWSTGFMGLVFVWWSQG